MSCCEGEFGGMPASFEREMMSPHDMMLFMMNEHLDKIASGRLAKIVNLAIRLAKGEITYPHKVDAVEGMMNRVPKLVEDEQGCNFEYSIKGDEIQVEIQWDLFVDLMYQFIRNEIQRMVKNTITEFVRENIDTFGTNITHIVFIDPTNEGEEVRRKIEYEDKYIEEICHRIASFMALSYDIYMKTTNIGQPIYHPMYCPPPSNYYGGHPPCVMNPTSQEPPREVEDPFSPIEMVYSGMSSDSNKSYASVVKDRVVDPPQEKKKEEIIVLDASLIEELKNKIENGMHGECKRTDAYFEHWDKLCNDCKKLKKMRPHVHMVCKDCAKKVAEHYGRKVCKECKYEYEPHDITQFIFPNLESSEICKICRAKKKEEEYYAQHNTYKKSYKKDNRKHNVDYYDDFIEISGH